LPSSYTTRNRADKQQTGENINTWGLRLNDGVLDVFDDALDGVLILSAAGPVTLGTANGAADQARKRVLNVTATGAVTITIPSVEKWYLVRAAVADVTVTNGASSVVISAGDIGVVFTDGASVFYARATDFNGRRLTRVGAPTVATDAATKKYVDDAALAGQASLPVGTGNRGRYLRVKADETGPEWEPDEIRLTADYTASVGDRLACDTTGGGFTVTLPASPREGDWVALRDAGNSPLAGGWSANALMLDPGAESINGETEVRCNLKGVAITLVYAAGEWSVKLG
jgi:hypothetical protein